MSLRAPWLCFLLLGAAPTTGWAQAERQTPGRAARRAALKAWWDQLKTERTLENRVVRAQLRGLLAAPPPPPDWTPRSAAGGRLERGPGGIPVLTLSGTPEQIGRQHGLLLKNELRAALQFSQAFVGARRELPQARRRAWTLFRAHTPPEILREVRAMAAAAAVDADELLFAQYFADLYRVFGCTTVSAPSPQGRFLARNLDFPSLGYIGRYSLLVVYRPLGRRPFVAVGWPGLVGVFSGQSEALALAVMTVQDPSGVRAGVPYALAFRQLLEQAGTVEDAVEQLGEVPLTSTNNLMLVDSRGQARVVELHPDGSAVRWPGAQGRLEATNHFLTGRLARPRLSLGHFSSRRRLARARAGGPDDAGPWRLAQAERVLARCETSFTQQQMIFLPQRGRLLLSFSDAGAGPGRGEFAELSLRELLGARGPF